MENKWLKKKGKTLGFFLPQVCNGGCWLCLYRKCCSLFEVRRKVFNLIFNFNPSKYVRDLEVNRVHLAEDPSYGTKVIPFKYWLPREFKAWNLNYLSIPATSCNLLIFVCSSIDQKYLEKSSTSYKWARQCNYYKKEMVAVGLIFFFRANENKRNSAMHIKVFMMILKYCNYFIYPISHKTHFRKIEKSWWVSGSSC